MKESFHTATVSGILRKSFLIWFFVFAHLLLNILYFVKGNSPNNLIVLVVINAVFLPVNIPALLIFIRYTRHSLHKRLTLAYETIRVEDLKSKQEITLRNSEIILVELHDSPANNRFPWMFHSYFILKDKEGKSLLICSYLMEISEFWQHNLTRRVKSEYLRRVEEYYPIIPLGLN